MSASGGSHQVLHTAPSVPVTNRSRWFGLGDHCTVIVAPGCILSSGWIANHDCQPLVGSYHVLQTVPSAPVANRSRWFGLGDHCAVIVAPGCILSSGWIANHDCQPLVGSYHVLQTVPSAPVANR